jgi:hypothetical protein
MSILITWLLGIYKITFYIFLFWRVKLLAFYNVYRTIHANWVSEWLSFNVKLAFSSIMARTSYIFQYRYHGENKLYFDVMMMMMTALD